MNTDVKNSLSTQRHSKTPFTATLYISLTGCHDQPRKAMTKGHILLSMSSLQSSQLNVRYDGGTSAYSTERMVLKGGGVSSSPPTTDL